MTRWFTLGSCLVAAVACSSGDGGPIAANAAHVIAISGSNFSSATLVEYAGPPLVLRRSMPLQLAGGALLLPRLRAGGKGAFYGLRIGQGPPASNFEVLRYDESWNPADSISGLALIGSDSLGVNAFQLTADGRYLVLEKASPPSDLIVLDATTLAIVNRISHPPMTLYEGALPLGTVGSQVMLRAGGTCGFRVFWMSIPGGAVSDSAAMPCNTNYAGAAAPHQLYIDPQGVDSQLVIFDGQTMQNVAKQDTMGTSYTIVADTGRGEIVDLYGYFILFADAHTLHVRRIVTLPGQQPAPPNVVNAAIDPVSGGMFATVNYQRFVNGTFVGDLELSLFDVESGALVSQMPISVLPNFLP